MSVSVIVPYFNAQNYLTTFVDDLATQVFNDFETIFIDDGSTDNSTVILKKALARYPLQVKLLKQTNKGVSAARNLGLKYAENDYVIFSDCDDRLDAQYLARLHEVAEEAQYDMVGCCAQTQNKKGQQSIIGQSMEYTNNNSLLIDFLDQRLPINLWTKMFRRQIAQQVQFAEDIQINEDKLYIYQICRLVNGANFIDDVLYHYQVNQESASRRLQKEFNSKCLDIQTVAKRIYNSCQYEFPRLALKHAYTSQMELLRILLRSREPHGLTQSLRQELRHQVYRRVERRSLERIEDFIFTYCWPLYKQIIRMDVHAYG